MPSSSHPRRVSGDSVLSDLEAIILQRARQAKEQADLNDTRRSSTGSSSIVSNDTAGSRDNVARSSSAGAERNDHTRLSR